MKKIEGNRRALGPRTEQAGAAANFFYEFSATIKTSFDKLTAITIHNST